MPDEPAVDRAAAATQDRTGFVLAARQAFATRFRARAMTWFTLAAHTAIHGRRPEATTTAPGSSEPKRFVRFWKTGVRRPLAGPVHVSMNDFWIHRARDIPRVALAGLQFRHAWPRTEGALGLWIAGPPSGRRHYSFRLAHPGRLAALRAHTGPSEGDARLSRRRRPAHHHLDSRATRSLADMGSSPGPIDRACYWRAPTPAAVNCSNQPTSKVDRTFDS